MILNKNRGSYGMFSRAGRSSTEKFHILMKKDEILNGNNKKVKLPDLFSPNDDSEVDLNDFDNYDDDMFSTDKLKFNPLKKNIKLKKGKKTKNDMSKFEEIINKNKRMNETPNFTKYNPKNEYIWKKIVFDQNWDKSIKKNFSIKPKEEIKDKFYIAHDIEGKNVRGKNFIDLARQTKRGSFQNIKTLSTEENEYKKNFNYYTNKKSKSQMNFYKNRSNLNSQQNSMIKNELYNSSSNFMNTQEDSNFANNINNNHDNKRETAYSINYAFKTSYSSFSNMKITNKKWNKIQAPDFKRMGSRDITVNQKSDKIRIIPFNLPSFDAIKERSINLVNYGKPKTLSKKHERPETCPVGAEIFDPYKSLSKINNHKESKAPNFDLMTSRPQTKDALPCFVQRLYSRQAANVITDKTLKMNHFSEGEFNHSQSSFFPKKSFNKIVNMNLLNSKEFVENYLKNSENRDEKQKEINDFIQKSMKFYNKNFDDLVKDGMLGRFDNITYKTIKRENKIPTGDLEKFLVNFEKIDIV